MAKKPKLTSAPGITDDEGHDGSSKSLDTAPANYSPAMLGSAPSAAEADAAAKTETPKPEDPATKKPSVPLKVFASLSGVKPDRFAGFARYAQLEEMRPCPVVEWKKRYEAFLKRPVR